MPLSDTAARQAKFTGKQQKLSDEKGLFLLITSSGKYWRLKFRFAGKEKVLALGVYPEVSLKEARAKREEARRQLADGIDPSLARKQSKVANRLASENSFEVIAREWHQSQLARWSPGHAQRVIESLEAVCCSQSEVENPLEHQEGCDGLVSVKLAVAPPPMMVVVKPVAHGLGINPEGE